MEVVPYISEEVVTVQAFSDGLLIAIYEKRCDWCAIRYTSFLKHKDLWKEEFVTSCYGVEVHGDAFKLGNRDDVP